MVFKLKIIPKTKHLLDNFLFPFALLPNIYALRLRILISPKIGNLLVVHVFKIIGTWAFGRFSAN